MSNRMPVLMAAQAVAMSARTDGLTLHAVEDMRVKAEELLSHGDELRLAVLTFATAYERDRRDPAAMAVHGTALEAEIREALNIAAPAATRTRADIDG